jgi:hypothetical protein
MARLITESMWRLGTVIRIPLLSRVKAVETRVEFNSVTKLTDIVVWIEEEPIENLQPVYNAHVRTHEGDVEKGRRKGVFRLQ